MKALILLILLEILFLECECSPITPKTKEDQIFVVGIYVDCINTNKSCVGPECSCSYFYYDHTNEKEHNCHANTCHKNSTCHNKIGKVECKCDDEFLDIRNVLEKERLEAGYKKDQYCLKEEDLHSKPKSFNITITSPGNQTSNTTDHCLNFKCPSNSTCFDYVDRAECYCNDGFYDIRSVDEPFRSNANFTGDNYCVSVYDCVNGFCPKNATCVKKYGLEMCQCNNGFFDIRSVSETFRIISEFPIGHYCVEERDFLELNKTFDSTTDYCLDFKCPNNSKCINYVDHPECKCDDLFELRIEMTNRTWKTINSNTNYCEPIDLSVDYSLDVPCPKNSTCQNLGLKNNYVECVCDDGFLDIRNHSIEFRLALGFNETQYCVKGIDVANSMFSNNTNLETQKFNETIDFCYPCSKNARCYFKEDQTICECLDGFLDIQKELFQRGLISDYVAGTECLKILDEGDLNKTIHADQTPYSDYFVICVDKICPAKTKCHEKIDDGVCLCRDEYVDIQKLYYDLKVAKDYEPGVNCSKPLNVTIDFCLENPCPNNSTCVNKSDHADCVCNEGFWDTRTMYFGLRLVIGSHIGQWCLKEGDLPIEFHLFNQTSNTTDNCLDFKCPENSTCVEENYRVKCECNEGFWDIKHVDEKTRLANGFKKDQYCAKEEDGIIINSTISYCPTFGCPSNSKCINYGDYSKCVCDDGFKTHLIDGPNFETRLVCVSIDFCFDDTCPENATCHNKIDGFECVCNDGFVDMRNGTEKEPFSASYKTDGYCLKEEGTPL